MVISLVIAFSLGGFLAYALWKQRKEAKQALDQHEKEKAKAPATAARQRAPPTSPY